MARPIALGRDAAVRPAGSLVSAHRDNFPGTDRRSGPCRASPGGSLSGRPGIARRARPAATLFRQLRGGDRRVEAMPAVGSELRRRLLRHRIRCHQQAAIRSGRGMLSQGAGVGSRLAESSDRPGLRADEPGRFARGGCRAGGVDRRRPSIDARFSALGPGVSSAQTVREGEEELRNRRPDRTGVSQRPLRPCHGLRQARPEGPGREASRGVQKARSGRPRGPHSGRYDGRRPTLGPPEAGPGLHGCRPCLRTAWERPGSGRAVAASGSPGCRKHGMPRRTGRIL